MRVQWDYFKPNQRDAILRFLSSKVKRQQRAKNCFAKTLDICFVLFYNFSMENKEKELFGITAPPVEEKKEPSAEEKQSATQENLYKVYGADIFVADKEIQEYYAMSDKLLCFANLLVGRFNSKGNYIISKEIKRDLVAMDKEVSEEGANFFKATNIYMKKNFYYYIGLSKTAEGKGKASLYLYEYVGDFMEKEFLTSHVADYVEELDQNFRDKVRGAFNLVDVDVPNDDRITPTLAVLMQKMIDEQLRSKELLEIACQVYVIRALKNFEKSPQGRKIIEKFKEQLARLSKGKMSYIKQKALLDRIVNSFGGYEVLDVDQRELQSLMQELTKTFNETVMRKATAEVVEPQKAEKKTEVKKAGAKKAGGKSGGGGAKKPAAKKKAAGKKDAKKDDKKKKGGGVTVAPFKKDEPKKDDKDSSKKSSKPEIKKLTLDDIINKHKQEEEAKKKTKPNPAIASPNDKDKDKDKDEFDEFDNAGGVNDRDPNAIEKLAGDRNSQLKKEQNFQKDEEELEVNPVDPEQAEKERKLKEEAEKQKQLELEKQEKIKRIE